MLRIVHCGGIDMKKILNALFLIALTLFFTTPVYAAETNAAEPDPYQAVLGIRTDQF